MSQITFILPHAFEPNSSKVTNARALRVLMDCFINLNMAFLQDNPRTPRLYDSGVRYGRTIEWDTIPALYAKQFGDCKSLTAALVAEYRLRGVQAEPVFRWAKHPTFSNVYHILVQTANGYEDPSKKLGMKLNAVW